MPRNSMNDLFDRFEKLKLPSKRAERTLKGYKSHIRKFRQLFGSMDIEDVTPKVLRDFMDVEQGKVNKDRELATLSVIFDYAVKIEWARYNPCREVDRHGSKPRERLVSDEEIEGIKECIGRTPDGLPKRMALAVDLARHTGIPQGELMELIWDRVDELRDNVIRYLPPKKKQMMAVDITPKVHEVLAQCRKLTVAKRSDYVMPTQFGKKFTSAGFRASWQREINKWDKRGHTRFTFNDLRMTWAHYNKAAAEQQGEGVEKALDAYPRFDSLTKKQALDMAEYYAIFFCLERYLRRLITDKMVKAEGPNWWNTNRIADQIRLYAAETLKKDYDNAMKRSPDELDYTAFGHLGQIISKNWDLFKDCFDCSEKGFSELSKNLNQLRSPIAHCSPFPDEEAEMFGVVMKRWFKVLR